jgi:Flp pilus assembly protein TadG
VIAVELAVAMPFLITTLLGVWDIGRLTTVSQILNNAAREGSRRASTGQDDVDAIKQAVLAYLGRAGISTTGVTITVQNETQPAVANPQVASQMDLIRVSVTLPSNNVRWIVLSSLLGSQTLSVSNAWHSMRDIPLTVSATIPID